MIRDFASMECAMDTIESERAVWRTIAYAIVVATIVQVVLHFIR